MLKTTLDVHMKILLHAVHVYMCMDVQVFVSSTRQFQTENYDAKFQRVGAWSFLFVLWQIIYIWTLVTS